VHRRVTLSPIRSRVHPGPTCEVQCPQIRAEEKQVCWKRAKKPLGAGVELKPKRGQLTSTTVPLTSDPSTFGSLSASERVSAGLIELAATCSSTCSGPALPSE
jgi:hypothetical protein